MPLQKVSIYGEVVENKHITPRKFFHFRLSWIASGVFSGTRECNF